MSNWFLSEKLKEKLFVFVFSKDLKDACLESQNNTIYFKIFDS